MKKIVFIAIAAIAFTTASQAQDSTSVKMKHGHEAKMHRPDMMSELNLTADQQEKLKQLRDDNHTKMEAIRNNASLSNDQKAEQMKSLHQEQRKSTEALLTDEQKTKWKQMRRDQMEHRRDMKSAADSTSQK